MMGIGTERNVNAERLLFFFDDAVCVYPAQSFDDFEYSGTEWNTDDKFYKKLVKGEEEYIIMRN